MTSRREFAQAIEVEAECHSERCVNMKSLNPLATFGAAVAAAFLANVSCAAPLSHGADALIKASATSSLVEQAHGTHRWCARGWVRRWGVVRWHRHVGVTRVPRR